MHTVHVAVNACVVCVCVLQVIKAYKEVREHHRVKLNKSISEEFL